MFQLIEKDNWTLHGRWQVSILQSVDWNLQGGDILYRNKWVSGLFCHSVVRLRTSQAEKHPTKTCMSQIGNHSEYLEISHTNAPLNILQKSKFIFVNDTNILYTDNKAGNIIYILMGHIWY